MVIVTGTSPKVARNLCTSAVRDAKTVNPEASEMACFFHPGEGGTQQMLIRGGSFTRANLLPFYTPF